MENTQSHQERKEGASPFRAFQGAGPADTLISDYGLQSCERMNLRCLKTTRSWFTSTAALRNERTSSSQHESNSSSQTSGRERGEQAEHGEEGVSPLASGGKAAERKEEEKKGRRRGRVWVYITTCGPSPTFRRPGHCLTHNRHSPDICWTHVQGRRVNLVGWLLPRSCRPVLLHHMRKPCLLHAVSSRGPGCPTPLPSLPTHPILYQKYLRARVSPPLTLELSKGTAPGPLTPVSPVSSGTVPWR